MSEEDISLWSVGVTLLVAVLAWKTLQQLLLLSKKSPPGPIGLPMLGYYPFICKDPVVGIRRIGEKYDKIFQINLLGENYYFLNSIDAVKEALSHNGLLAAGRPTEKFDVLKHAVTKKNFMSIGGEIWRKNQQLIKDNFAKQGVGKAAFDAKVHEICDTLVDHIRRLNGKEHNFRRLFANFASNVTSYLLFSKYYHYDDPAYLKLFELTREFYLYAPNLDSFLVGTLFRWVFYMKGHNYSLLQSLKERLFEFWKPIMDEKLTTVDEHNAKDVLDFYMCAHKHEKITTEKNELFDVETISSNLSDLFIGGTQPTSNTLYHAVHLMVTHPEVQKKVQEEIEEKVGKRKVYMSDRSVLPYTHAVLCEIQRYVCVVPFGFVRTNEVPLKVVGYDLPARSNIVVHIWKILRDPNYFKNPHNFDPSNFLDDKGQFVKKDAHIPLSYGKRKCIALPVADVELFICFATLMQKFHWLPPEGEMIRVNIFNSLNRILSDFSVRAVDRGN